MVNPLHHHIETLYLFTKSDYKTIFFPVLMFSLAVADSFDWSSFIFTVIWLWLHLLQANVSNQTYSGHEDLVNKPWRPLPSGRVTAEQARSLRWLLVPVCLGFSIYRSPWVFYASAALTLVEIVHDDFECSGHLMLKNFCNVGGYTTFEVGASVCMNGGRPLDGISLMAIVSSGILIFTTISAQDFADVAGDKLSGRRTLPIVAPEGSRYYILFVLMAWSAGLANLCSLGPTSGALFFAMGALVGTRYFFFRDPVSDKRNYLLYNIWLLAAHLLPYNLRARVFEW
ncbi:hypothetical protein PM082_004890 [Marasmius tenuissimus]|nr:hypothetical protein PM082_004890 [Marasmius tenuissimus]